MASIARDRCSITIRIEIRGVDESDGIRQRMISHHDLPGPPTPGVNGTGPDDRLAGRGSQNSRLADGRAGQRVDEGRLARAGRSHDRNDQWRRWIGEPGNQEPSNEPDQRCDGDVGAGAFQRLQGRGQIVQLAAKSDLAAGSRRLTVISGRAPSSLVKYKPVRSNTGTRAWRPTSVGADGARGAGSVTPGP